MTAALDRLTASVSAATTALTDATAAAGSTGPSDDAALNALADSLDGAVASYRTATSSGSGNPLAPDAN